MQNLYDVLGVPADASKSYLKKAFINWKKEQQEILKKGKPEEQKIASDNITEITSLYKEIVKDLADDNKNNDNVKQSEQKNYFDSNEARNNKYLGSSYSYSNSGGANQNMIAIAVVLFMCCLAGGWYMTTDNTSSVKAKNSSNVLLEESTIAEQISNKLLSIFFDEKKKNATLESTQVSSNKSSNSKESSDNISNDIKTNAKSALISSESKAQEKEAKLTEEDLAKQNFIEYHDALGNHRFNDAYNLMSPKCQQNMGAPDKLANDFRDTIEGKVSSMRLIKKENDEMVFEFVLDSKDRAGGNKILYQTFKGQVHMFKINGVWKVGYSEAKQLNEYVK